MDGLVAYDVKSKTDAEKTFYEGYILTRAIGEGIYVLYAMFHAMFLLWIAFTEFNFIYDALNTFAEKRGGVDKLTNLDGIRCLLFGIILGVGGYFSGTGLGHTEITRSVSNSSNDWFSNIYKISKD